MTFPDPTRRTTTLNEAVAALTQHLARLDQVQVRPWDDALAPRLPAEIARFQAAQAALDLAAALLATDHPLHAQAAQEQAQALAHSLKQWRKEGRGWFEERYITKEKVHSAKNPLTGEVDLWTESHTYGPYYYFRWRDETGKTHTRYFGRNDPRERPPLTRSLADLATELEQQAPSAGDEAPTPAGPRPDRGPAPESEASDE